MRANVEIRRTVRGNVARVGGALAGVVLAWGMQPLAMHAHERAADHQDAYAALIHEAGITWGYDTNGNQPGDDARIQAAHAEWDKASDWQYATLGLEAGAIVLLGSATIAGHIAARRDETQTAIWHAATTAQAAGE
jgi:hypothetical protein